MDSRCSSWLLERLTGDVTRLHFGKTTIGRQIGSDIRISEKITGAGFSFASRNHAEIEVSENDQTVEIRDLDSKNGVFVNGIVYKQTKTVLKAGDHIGIGVYFGMEDDDDGDLENPVFLLKFMPLRRRQCRLPAAVVENNTKPVPPTPAQLAASALEQQGKEGTAQATKTEAVPQSTSGPTELAKAAAQSSSSMTQVDSAATPKNPQPSAQPIQPNETNTVLIHGAIITLSDDEDEKVNKVVGKEAVVKSTPSSDLLPKIVSVEHVKPASSSDLLPKIVSVEHVRPASASDLLPKIVSVEHVKPESSEILPKCLSVVGKVSDDILPSSTNNNQERNKKSPSPVNGMHMPIIPRVKVEHVRNVSADIKSIFGDTDELILNTVKPLNPLVYNSLNGQLLQMGSFSGSRKPLVNGECFCLTSSDEDEEVEKLGEIIECAPTTESLGSKEQKVIEPENPTKSLEDDNNLNDDDEEEEGMMFSQMLIKDMKAELTQANDDGETAEDIPFDLDQLQQANYDQPTSCTTLTAEKETTNRNLDSSVWVISDDEDFDEELESKVSGWSNRLFSQSLSQQVNTYDMSQVYELDDNRESEDEDDDDKNCDKHDEDNAEEEDFDAFANDFYNREFDDADRIIDEMFVSLKDKIAQKCEEERKESAENDDETKDKDKQGKSVAEDLRNKTVRQKELKVKLVKIDDERKRESDVTDLSESPIIKRRSSAVSKRLLSSSEDETEEGSSGNEPKSNEIANKTSIDPKITSKDDATSGHSSSAAKISHKVDERRKSTGNDNSKPIKRGPPPVIDAPQLPKHKGKLRGVSAVASPVMCAKKLAQIRENIRSVRNTNDLKSKWLEKPSVGKKRQKEQHKVIQQSRKEKLKELADKEHKHHDDEPRKRKLSEDIERSSKKPKVKLTTANRGSFLTEETETVAPKTFKIPRVNKTAETANLPAASAPKDISTSGNESDLAAPPNGEKCKIARNLSVDQVETFSQQLSKPDKVLLKRQHSIDVSCLPSSSSSSIATTTKPAAPVRKEAVTARSQRTTNKITFASMQKNFSDTLQNQKKLEQMTNNNISCLSDTGKRDADTGRTKKRVRFNDEPIIHYIERVSGASKKADKKELMPRTSHIERRQAVRLNYPILDCTSKITSKILEWSNEWLVRRNAKADAAGDVIYPMPDQFRDFEHYKSIIFPLMKLEFMSMLEHDYNASGSVNSFKVSLEYVTNNKERLTIITKFAYQNKKEQDASKCDLVILDFGRTSTFAFMATNRIRATGSFSSNTIVFEIMSTNFSKEFFKSIKEIGVRPVVDNVRVEFGAVNAVYQLAATPLFHKILDPLELLKYRKAPQKRKPSFKGYDNLNETQRQVVLNAYGKAIDEKMPTITLIQGPPGTGKSCVITNLTLQLLYGDEVRWLDKKILICAQSNAAVDVIAEKLFRIRYKMRPEQQFRVVRFGIVEKISPKVLPISLQKLVENEQKKRLQAHNKDMQIENMAHLAEQMKQLELQIAEMKTRDISGTVEEDALIDKKRKLHQMKNIANASMCQKDERSLYEWFLNNANIVCATLSSCVKMSQYVNYFDMCIIDEATQCTEPYTLLPLKFGISSLVLVGDTQQLPATVLSKKAYDYGLGVSMFTRIQNCLETAHKSTTIETPSGTIHMLQTQYRMNAEICKWPNLYFYKNKLTNADITKKYKTDIQPFCILNLSYANQNKRCDNGKISNNLEAQFVAQLLKALDGFIPTTYNSYGVITPYAHHRNTLENAIKSTGLTHVMVNTIDSYQGLEKDVIIISNARTSGIGFLANPQRLNVALTRPRKCLILCGNFKHLETVPAWKSVLANARERNIFYEISANCLDDIQRNVIDKIRV